MVGKGMRWKGCPICGSEDLHLNTTMEIVASGSLDHPIVSCGECKTQFRFDYKGDVTGFCEVWNRRAEDDGA